MEDQLSKYKEQLHRYETYTKKKTLQLNLTQELEELESLAVEYNLATEKKMKQMRKQILQGQADQNDHVKKLTKRLAPILALKEEIKKLKKAAK